MVTGHPDADPAHGDLLQGAGAQQPGKRGRMSGVATPLDKHVLYGVRVIVEKQPLDNIWQPFRWVISDLMPLRPQAGGGAPPINNTRLERLRAHGGAATGDDLFFADAWLDLHHAEAEAYAENLASSDPAIYLVLRHGDEDEDELETAGEDDAPGLRAVALYSGRRGPDRRHCRSIKFVSAFVDARYRERSSGSAQGNLDARTGGRRPGCGAVDRTDG